MIAFLVLETFMVGTFCALDFVLFYMFFEGVLIPMFLIIGIWGGPRRVYSAFKFFLYTLLGSVLMLLAIIAMYFIAGTTDIPTLMQHASSPPAMQRWLWLAFFASFAVKMPMWPVHTWLPDAHVEAPTAGSVILAGVLLKMGAYGFLRFSLPMLPQASAYFAPLVYALSVGRGHLHLAGGAGAGGHEEADRLFLGRPYGLRHRRHLHRDGAGREGAIFQMLSHGIVSGALFLIVGVVYDRLHTREIARYGGLVNRMPVYAAIFMLFMLASVGLPGTSGFIGEFLVHAGRLPGQYLGGVLRLPPASSWAPPICSGSIAGSSSASWTKADLMNMLDLEPARDRDLRAAGPDGHVDGHLSHVLHRYHGAGGRPPDRQLSHGACRCGDAPASGQPRGAGEPDELDAAPICDRCRCRRSCSLSAPWCC